MKPIFYKTAQTGMLAAASLVISALEMMLPDLPMLLPGAKPGLSNIINLLCAQTLGLSYALTIVIIKALFAFATRGFTAFIMSLCGGLFSTLIMFLFLKIKKPLFSYIGIGISGALTHNTAQLAIALVIVGRAVIYYIPMLMIISLITGSISGLCGGILIPRAQSVMGIKNKFL